MRIVIAGAGITGCAAAMLLAREGHDVRVFEAVPEVNELGVGINLLPHAVSILDRIGMADKLEALGVATRELVYYNRHGQRIWGEPRGRFAGYPVPQVSIHRGALQVALFKEAQAQLGAERVVTGHRLVAADDKSPVTATFERADGSRIEVEADILVGADGIHSTLRRLRYPDEGLPRYGGRILWRAVTRAKPYLTGATMIMAGYQDRKFVCYPISRPDADGMQVINWIAELTVDQMPGREDWNKECDRAVFADQFADWTFDWLDVPGLIAGAEKVFEFPLVDRDPLPAWSFGATTLLGDAAHPMYPIGSNGASQGILDADALVRALAANGDPVAALKAYEAERLPATAQIVLTNRQNGPEICMQMAEERAPQGFANIADVFAEGELEAIAARYKAVAGFSKEAVAAKAAKQPA
ncbi:MAG: flavin-dependent oxidoreductase [Sphingomonadales bacterium]|nr:flavin-dependent oxidoreductase [Sphingomonadales bacterium]